MLFILKIESEISGMMMDSGDTLSICENGVKFLEREFSCDV